MAHTPGPWQTNGEHSHEVLVRNEIGDGFMLIAHCPRIYVGARRGQEYANARLIAAAPELLEACKAILQALQDGDLKFSKKRQSDSDPYHPANAKLVAAIAKAEGDA